MAIRVQHLVRTRKRADEKQKGRLWEVKVGDQRGDHSESMTRSDEQVGRARGPLDIPPVIDGQRLQRPRRGRANRDDTPASVDECD